MAGIEGEPLGPPTPAQPVGVEAWPPVSAPTSAKVGLTIPERGDMSATERWEQGTEHEDAPDDSPPFTSRHSRAI
jgi:hypothetical protein